MTEQKQKKLKEIRDKLKMKMKEAMYGNFKTIF